MNQCKCAVPDGAPLSRGKQKKCRCCGIAGETWKTIVAVAVGLLLISLTVWTMTAYNMKVVELSDRLRRVEEECLTKDSGVRQSIEELIEQKLEAYLKSKTRNVRETGSCSCPPDLRFKVSSKPPSRGNASLSLLQPLRSYAAK